jgi:hypothetical protein
VESKDEKRPRRSYRQRAVEMLKLAKEARSSDAKSSYLHLAASWDALARQGGGNPD